MDKTGSFLSTSLAYTQSSVEQKSRVYWLVHKSVSFLRDEEFNHIQSIKKAAWNFSDSWQQICSEILKLTITWGWFYQKLGCKLYFSRYIFSIHTWIFFPANYGAVSNEHGERFHHDISAMEECCQGSLTMLANYCWTVTKGAPEDESMRKAKCQGESVQVTASYRYVTNTLYDNIYAKFLTNMIYFLQH